ncbi:hypothetical protein [Arsukibacterium perlucidum]|uniref:hypothetical protein n=1 Tax=Arsukibacterium perlucidum TaxID=368811 RepID=UPI0012F99F91|nr:hypothetical protein [Arsukibacterium perlucidum]
MELIFMLVYPKMLILAPKDIDAKFISPLRDKTKYKLNEWRNIFAQAIGFKSFIEMSKRESVLLNIDQVLKVIDSEADPKLRKLMLQSAAWYVPSQYDSYLCVNYWDDTDYFSSTIYEDDGRGLWSPNERYFRLGKVCISKSDSEKLIEELNDRIEHASVEELCLSDCISTYDHVQRSHPYDYWSNNNDHEGRKALLDCRTLPQLYAAVCDFAGIDGEEYFARFGFTISDFIEEIMNDENCLIGQFS